MKKTYNLSKNVIDIFYYMQHAPHPYPALRPLTKHTL